MTRESLSHSRSRAIGSQNQARSNLSDQSAFLGDGRTLSPDIRGSGFLETERLDPEDRLHFDLPSAIQKQPSYLGPLRIKARRPSDLVECSGLLISEIDEKMQYKGNPYANYVIGKSQTLQRKIEEAKDRRGESIRKSQSGLSLSHISKSQPYLESSRKSHRQIPLSTAAPIQSAAEDKAEEEEMLEQLQYFDSRRVTAHHGYPKIDLVFAVQKHLRQKGGDDSIQVSQNRRIQTSSFLDCS
eukprot:TRINITY_DN13958_c0_g1_i2.p1 TRINITY_DN13958_c0_g1~~TRINITY_DN13958_c0_g1_i2.p1  ORF type:complete len:242 (-),score=4.50 TRINITY_DN13958_c0_g1_i2:204-929(-)